MEQKTLFKRNISWNEFKCYGLKITPKKKTKPKQTRFSLKGLGAWHKDQRRLNDFRNLKRGDKNAGNN